MNEMLRLLIADGNGPSRETFATELSRLGYAVFTASDGGQALAAIEALSPDVAALTLTLPVYDGYGVLDALTKRPLSRYPFLIALSAMGKESLARALAMGADEAAERPVSPLALEAMIRRLPERGVSRLALRQAEKRGETARRQLQEIGMREKLKGFGYLARAVALASTDDRLLRQATGVLYPMIGRESGASGNSVERAIRHTIESTWTHGNVEVLHRVFGNSIAPQRGKPTNSECIAMLAHRLVMAIAREDGEAGALARWGL